MQTHDAIAIVFDYPLEADRVVPLDEVWSFVDQERGTMWTACRIVWRDGSHSFAKSWWSDTGAMCRIGAGAYGDWTILDRPHC